MIEDFLKELKALCAKHELPLSEEPHPGGGVVVTVYFDKDGKQIDLPAILAQRATDGTSDLSDLEGSVVFELEACASPIALRTLQRVYNQNCGLIELERARESGDPKAIIAAIHELMIIGGLICVRD